MYAAHKKDINRNKSFHPLTFNNLSKVEAKLEVDAEKTKQMQGRKIQLQREADERRYDELLVSQGDAGTSSGEGGERAAKYRRVEWMGFSREPGAENDDDDNASKPTPAEDVKEKAGVVGPQSSTGRLEPAVTGAVTSSDAAALRKEADEQRKRRLDPLAKVLAQEDEYIGQVAKAQQHSAAHHHPSGTGVRAGQPTSAGSTNAESNQKKIQSAIQQLLAIKKKL